MSDTALIDLILILGSIGVIVFFCILFYRIAFFFTTLIVGNVVRLKWTAPDGETFETRLVVKEGDDLLELLEQARDMQRSRA